MRKKLDRLGTLTSPFGLKNTRTANWRSWGSYVYRPMAFIVFVFGLIFNLETTSASPRPIMEMKLYALNNLPNWEQFECYNELIYRESRWNPLAKNGSHYGLGQMRNAKVAKLGWRDQIKWHLVYISNRYNGSACKALDHLKKWNWH